MQAGNGVNGRAGGPAFVVSGGGNQKKWAPHVRTTDDLGRWGGASESEPVAEPSILNSAQKLLADLSRGLEGEIERLKALMGDETGGTDFGKLMKAIQMNQKALLTVLDQRVKLEDARTARASAGRRRCFIACMLTPTGAGAKPLCACCATPRSCAYQHMPR
jgi:hypothetical protein